MRVGSDQGAGLLLESRRYHFRADLASDSLLVRSLLRKEVWNTNERSELESFYRKLLAHLPTPSSRFRSSASFLVEEQRRFELRRYQ